LEALFRKLKSLADVPKGQLAGKIGVVVDLMTRLPVEIWFQENPRSADTNLESNLLNLVKTHTLLLLDRGFYHFYFWQQLIDQRIDFITRLKKGATIQVKQVFTDSYALRDRLIQSYVVADLYRQRWRIEEAFNIVKRLLGLSYLWTGSLNGVKLQIWGTWLFYAVLVDLGDAVADELSLPFDSISLEMIYRGLYHFYVAHQKGLASDPVKYFAAPENQDLGIVKQQRKHKVKLIVAPFPDRERSRSEFFFQPFCPNSSEDTVGGCQAVCRSS
jgi:hypothetical protein